MDQGAISKIFSIPAHRSLYKGDVLITANISFLDPSPVSVGSVGDLVLHKRNIKTKLIIKYIATRISVTQDRLPLITLDGASHGVTGI